MPLSAPDIAAGRDRHFPAAPHLWALLGYFVLALIVTYPAAAIFTTGVPGDLTADRDQNLWNLWWTGQALQRGANPFHTDMLYYPYGTGLYYHTLALPLGIIGLLPQALLGLPAAYNTVLLVAFTLSGYGMFRLCLLLTGRALPSFLGGVVFAFTPYTLDALKGQLEVLSLQWMPLFAEAWIRAQARRSLRWAAIAGAFFALTAYTSLYYAVYLLLFAAAYLLVRVLRALRGARTEDNPLATSAKSSITASAVALLLVLPLAAGLAANRDNPRLAVGADPAHRLAHSADLLSFIAFPHDHPLAPVQVERPGVNEPPIHSYLSLGYAALALSVLGTVIAWRSGRSWFWVGLGLLALLLAMGPQLQVGRTLTGVPLPFALIEGLPGFSAIAKPERFVVLARLCMGVLAALGAGWLLARFMAGGRLTRLAPFALVLALLLVELPIHPRYVEDLSVPAALGQLSSDSNGGLMELPFATQQAETIGERMRYQTAHGKPIMAGYLARTYNSPIVDSCSPFWGFISPLDVPREGAEVASPLAVDRPLDVLNLYKISHIALYSSYGGRGGTPVEGDQIAAYRDIVSAVSGAPPLPRDPDLTLSIVRSTDLSQAPPSFHIGQGWHRVEDAGGAPFRWVRDGTGTICVFSPRQVTASLVLEATSYAQEGSVDIVIGNGGSGSLSGRSVPPGGAFAELRTPSVQWQPGVTEVRLVSRKAGITPQSVDASIKDDRALTVGTRRVRLEIETEK